MQFTALDFIIYISSTILLIQLAHTVMNMSRKLIKKLPWYARTYQKPKVAGYKFENII